LILVQGEDEATGLTYGAEIELEADTDTTTNADAMFVYVRDGWGEFRLGDTDGVVEQMKVAASTFAAFSGGLDAIDPFDYPALVYGVDSESATKIAYYSPELAGFQLGLSYTPHRDDNVPLSARPTMAASTM
jgi:hypothetical protein